MSTPTEQHPAGPYVPESVEDPARRSELIEEIVALPARLRAAVDGLGGDQLDTRYRPDAWTVRQIVHHVPDSHANAYIRWKLALTEEHPTIRPYDETACAELLDSASGDIAPALVLLEAIHVRWVQLMRTLSDAQWRRGFHHPEGDASCTLIECLPMYAWHGRHHLAQVTSVRDRF